MFNSSRHTVFLVLSLLVVLGGGLLSLLSGVQAPLDVSVDGYRIDAAFRYTTILITGYFLAVIGIMCYCLARFQSRPGHKALYTHGDRPVHLVISLMLAMLVFSTVDLKLIRSSVKDVKEAFWNFPTGDDVVRVEVIGKQFEWLFRYPGPDGKFDTADDVAQNGVLQVPVNRKIHLRLRSQDVIHSLFLPNARVKIDVIPGRTNELWFQLTQTGKFEMACAELCGLGHYRMRGWLEIQTQEQFDAFIEEEAEISLEDYDPDDDEYNWGWKWEDR